METEEQFNDAIREMRSIFLVPLSDDTFANFASLANNLTADYKALADAFKQNLTSFLSTMAMPYALAFASVHERHAVRVSVAERIRALNINVDSIHAGESLEEVRDQKAKQVAQARLADFFQSEDGQNVVIQDVCDFLLNGLRQGLGDAAHELLRQGVILLWSAFEVFFRDVFELYLNRDASRTQALVRHPETRKRFEAEKFSLDTLLKHGFDLSRKVGTILVSQQDFSDLRTVKAAYPVLFPTASNLIAALGNRDLWVLFQRRHIIAHRRGVVDQSYIDETGDSIQVGSRLSITPDKLESDLKVVLLCGEALCDCLRSES